MIDYNGRKFRDVEAGPDAPVGTYHQAGDLVWATAEGGDVRRCVLTGRCAPDGTITLGYTMVLTDGRLVVGRCVSTPQTLPDGRIRLREAWERFLPDAGRGVSYIEET